MRHIQVKLLESKGKKVSERTKLLIKERKPDCCQTLTTIIMPAGKGIACLIYSRKEKLRQRFYTQSDFQIERQQIYQHVRNQGIRRHPATNHRAVPWGKNSLVGHSPHPALMPHLGHILIPTGI